MSIFDKLSIEPAANASEPWGGYDFSKPSLVVVAVNENDDGAVLWGVGGHIRMEMEEAGLSHLDDLGLHPPSAGVWVWEGSYVWQPGGYEYPMDGSSEPEGRWRLPTEEEWAAIKAGRCPWNDDDMEPNVTITRHERSDTLHNHITRDIKQPGECPRLDALWGAFVTIQVRDHMREGRGAPEEADMARFIEEADAVVDLARNLVPSGVTP